MSVGDGLPGAYRIVVKPTLAGAWSFAAQWEGRDLAGLRLEDAEGKVLARTAGSTPLILTLEVDRGMIRREERLLLRFAPMVSRGTLSGVLQVTGPEDTTAKAAPPPEKKLLPSWPMSCVLWTGKSQQKIPPERRALTTFAKTLRDATEEETAWARRWLVELKMALSAPGETQSRREALDALWEHLRLDPPPGEGIARAFRATLGAMEDVVRREAARPDPAPFLARRESGIEILDCLLEESP